MPSRAHPWPICARPVPITRPEYDEVTTIIELCYPGDMSTGLRASDHAASEWGDVFQQAVCESIAPYEFSGVVRHSADELRGADIGPLNVVRARWARGEGVRNTRLVHRADPELFKIDISTSGQFFSEQLDRQATLGARSFTFVDLARPHRIAADRADLTIVIFPRTLLPLPDKHIAELTGLTFDATQPEAALVTSVVRELAGNLDAYHGPVGAMIGQSILDLITAALAARLGRPHLVPQEARQQVLVRRIHAFIEQNLGHRDLAPPLIAARHHISLRLLHKLFEREGTTVAGLIRARRLDRCRRDLIDPNLSATPISTIARRWGFSDPAHFSRSFRSGYGITPGQYRHSGLGKAAGDSS